MELTPVGRRPSEPEHLILRVDVIN